MYLDLTDILRAPGTSVEKHIELAPLQLDEFEVKTPIQGWVRAANARRNIVVTGYAATSVVQECARCLRDFAQPLELDLEAVAPVSFFMSRLTGIGNGEDEHAPENELTNDELAALFDAHTLDVLELIRQAIVLQISIAPHCSDECPGLPEAANYQQERDARWESLAQWQPSPDAPAQNN